MPYVDQRNVDANAVVVGPVGNTGPLQSVAMTNGKILVGKTGYPPVAASAGSSDGSVIITGGAGTIDITVNPAVKDKAIASADASVVVTTGASTVDLSVASSIRDKAIASADHSVAVTTTGSVDLSVIRPYNYLFNGDLEIWGSGTSAAPTTWSLTGGGATVAKATAAGAFVLGTASAAVTRVGSNCFLQQDALTVYPPAARWAGQTVTLGCWVQAFAANLGFLFVNDGVAQTTSSAHSGSGSWEFLTVTHTVAASPTQLLCALAVLNTNGTVRFDGATLVMGRSLANSVPSGWQGRKMIMALSSGTVPFTVNPSYYGVGAGSTTDFGYFAITPYKGVARRLFCTRNGVPATTPTDTLRVYTGAASLDTALVSAFNASANFTSVGAGADVTHEVELGIGWAIEIKTIETGNVAHTACFEYEEIPA